MKCKHAEDFFSIQYFKYQLYIHQVYVKGEEQLDTGTL